MPFFIAVNGLAELENQEKWEEARALLYTLWNADRGNIDLLLRLFSECWYVLCMWGCMMNEDPFESPLFLTLRDNLIECTTYGLTHFNRDPRFMWMAGYMISMFPYLFYVDGDLYDEWETKGRDMLTWVYKQNPDDLMVRVMYFGWGSKKGGVMYSERGSKEDQERYREAKRKLTPILGEYFTEDTEIERYFKERLTDPITGGRNETIPLKISYEDKNTQGRYYGTGDHVVILSNMDTNNRDDWMPFVQSLPLDHCSVLIYDYLQQEEDQSHILEDVISYAKSAGGEKIVLIGAGIGGVASLKLAARPAPDKAVVGVVSISAPFKHKGIAFFSKEKLSRIKIPKLLINTEDDELAASTRQMHELMPEPKELCFYPGGAHGTEIFDTTHRDALIAKLNAFVNARFGF